MQSPRVVRLALRPSRLAPFLAAALIAVTALVGGACDSSPRSGRDLEATGGGPVTLERQSLHRWSRSARIVPAMDDGRVQGVRLYSIAPDGAFGRMGLQNGDLVTAINGIPVDSNRWPDLFRELQDSSFVELQIERDGKSLTAVANVR